MASYCGPWSHFGSALDAAAALSGRFAGSGRLRDARGAAVTAPPTDTFTKKRDCRLVVGRAWRPREKRCVFTTCEGQGQVLALSQSVETDEIMSEPGTDHRF